MGGREGSETPPTLPELSLAVVTICYHNLSCSSIYRLFVLKQIESNSLQCISDASRFGHVREWSLFTAGGCWNSKNCLHSECVPSTSGNCVFAPFQTFALNSCPPQRLYIRVLRHMTIHQSTYHAKYVMKMENPYSQDDDYQKAFLVWWMGVDYPGQCGTRISKRVQGVHEKVHDSPHQPDYYEKY